VQPEELQQRLSRISTVWTLVARAHTGPDAAGAQAQASLLERYQHAVYLYLLGALRNADAADEVFQEFALRFVRGDFRRADESKGRFRDYVRTALKNLIHAHRTRQNARGRLAQMEEDFEEALAADEEPIDLDAEFLKSWRQALLDRAWAGLSALQQPGGPPFHTALRLRYEQPDLTSGQLAELLTSHVQPRDPYTEAGVRKIVQRARDLFADLLLDEVGRSLGTSSLDEVERELIDLGFQAHCKRALDRRRRARS
jgi:RNA polymerase sigma-70 factor (ECF subfamily)